MKILGLSPLHDASACLVVDGKIQKYFKEERLNGVKRSTSPKKSIKKCVDQLSSIDYLSYSSVTHEMNFPDKNISLEPQLKAWISFINRYCKVENFENFSETHHLQHACSTFYSSGFDEAAVIIIDGKGSNFGSIAETETIFHASYPNNFVEIYKTFIKGFRFNKNDVKVKQKQLPDCEIEARSSLGITFLYCTATQLINQNLLENGKTMGLSAYGNYKNKYNNFFIPGSCVVDMSDFVIDGDLVYGSTDVRKIYHKDHHNKNSNVTIDNYSFYADYALHVQKETERAVELLVIKAIEKTGLKKICFGGGYALNVVSNFNLLKKFPDVQFFFDPMSDDGGSSIGGALYLYRSISNDKKINPLKNNFIHGKEYDLSKIDGIPADYMDIAKLICSEKTVAIYHGLAEAGPRALGHRSILFDPRVKDGKKKVNRIKKREWYRPFAASMLKEDADKYFDYIDNIGYQYMTINAMAKNGTKELIPSVIHEDGSCRIHIVEDKSEPLYQLLLNFKKITGIGILLNTSFNLAGLPLVETPEDAIDSWNNSEINCLWFPKIKTTMIK